MSNSTSQNQETKQLPLDSPLIKLAFLPQNHPKYLWKRIGTEEGLPTFKVERLDRGFPIRKAPISVNISGWCNSGIIRCPWWVLLQNSRNVRRWILLVNGFPWVPNSSRIRWVEGKISEKEDGTLYWPGYFSDFHNDLQWKSPFPFCQRA